MDDKDIVKKGYDEIAERYLESRSKSSKDVLLIQELIDRLPEGARVLDAGCGAGDPIAKILSENYSVVGIDFSENQVALARKNVPDAAFQIMDMTELDFPEKSFNAVVSYYAIIHIHRDKHKGIIGGFHRVLKQGGLLFLCTGATDLDDDVNEDYLGTKMYWSHYESETNKLMVEAAGFEIIWAKVVGDDSCGGGGHLFILAIKM